MPQSLPIYKIYKIISKCSSQISLFADIKIHSFPMSKCSHTLCKMPAQPSLPFTHLPPPPSICSHGVPPWKKKADKVCDRKEEGGSAPSRWSPGDTAVHRSPCRLSYLLRMLRQRPNSLRMSATSCRSAAFSRSRKAARTEI